MVKNSGREFGIGIIWNKIRLAKGAITSISLGNG